MEYSVNIFYTPIMFGNMWVFVQPHQNYSSTKNPGKSNMYYQLSDTALKKCAH